MSTESPLSVPLARSSNLWEVVYFSAWAGCVDCYESTLDALPRLPVTEQGDAWAVAARGWWMLGHPVDARRAWELACTLGGPEVEALRPFVEPRGAALAWRRAETLRDPGLRADAWCDALALSLLEGDPERAHRALERALEGCPDHAEARHWRRALETPGFAPAARSRARRRKDEDALVARDRAALMPTRQNGWVSPERQARRALVPPVATPSGSALARLRAAGVHAGLLASPADWARTPEDHAWVEAELSLDRLKALADEGRPAADLATATWREAAAADDPERLAATAHVYCQLGFLYPELREHGAAAADRLGALRGATPRDRAFQAWFSAHLERTDAVPRAVAVLRERLDDEWTWRLALAALYRCGGDPLVGPQVERALRDPVRAGWASRLRGKWAERADKVWMSVRGRWEGAEEAW